MVAQVVTLADGSVVFVAEPASQNLWVLADKCCRGGKNELIKNWFNHLKTNFRTKLN